jgi:hypothetical protein
MNQDKRINDVRHDALNSSRADAQLAIAKGLIYVGDAIRESLSDIGSALDSGLAAIAANVGS